ncbi:ExeA family protein, partial [Ideonella livida]
HPSDAGPAAAPRPAPATGKVPPAAAPAAALAGPPYLAAFGLREAPFSIAPDPRRLYLGPAHAEALAHLLHALQGSGGVVVLTGEVGAGKTTLGRAFLSQVPPGTPLACIFNPPATELELLATVVQEFGLPLPEALAGPLARRQLQDRLHHHLLACHAQGRQALLLIDEAQRLPAEVLEALRLLTNLETDERKLLQIVLIGQPELRAQLALPGLRQLDQRVVARCHLPALTPQELPAYLATRWQTAGGSAPPPFEPSALDELQRRSGGVPRRLNLLCDRALLGCWAQGRRRVDRATVRQAAREVLNPLAPTSPAAAQAWGGRGAGLLVGGLGALGLGAVLALLASRALPEAERAAGPASAASPGAAASVAAAPVQDRVPIPVPAAPPSLADWAAPTTQATLQVLDRQAWVDLLTAWGAPADTPRLRPQAG